jgi:tRNA1(Val) A37 N6-methylase TrmN6
VVSSATYTNCTVFDVTTGAGTVKLALDTNMSTNVRIDHDGSFNFQPLLVSMKSAVLLSSLML